MSEVGEADPDYSGQVKKETEQAIIGRSEQLEARRCNLFEYLMIPQSADELAFMILHPQLVSWRKSLGPFTLKVTLILKGESIKCCTKRVECEAR